MNKFIESLINLSRVKNLLKIPIKLFKCSSTEKFEESNLCSLNATSLLDKLPLDFKNDEHIYFVSLLNEKESELFLNILSALYKQNKSLLIEIDNLNTPNFAIIEPITSCSAVLCFLKREVSKDTISLFNPLNLEEFITNIQSSKLTFYELDIRINEIHNENDTCKLCKTKLSITCDAIVQTNNKYFTELDSTYVKDKKLRNKISKYDDHLINKKRCREKKDKSSTLGSLVFQKQFGVQNSMEIFNDSITEEIFEETGKITPNHREIKVAHRMLTPLISKPLPLMRTSPALNSLLGGKILSPPTSLSFKSKFKKQVIPKLGIAVEILSADRSSLMVTPTRSNRLRSTPSKYNDFNLQSPVHKKPVDNFKARVNEQKREKITSENLKNNVKLNKQTPNKIDYQQSKLKKSKYTPVKVKIYSKSFRITPNKNISNNAMKRTLTNKVAKKNPLLIHQGNKITSKRSEIILQKSKEVAKQRSLNDEDSINKSNNSLTESLKRNSINSKLSDSNEMTAFQEHRNVDDLLNFLKIAYIKIVEGEGSPFTGAKSIVGSCLMFFNEKNYENAHEETKRFMNINFLKNNSEIRDQYISKSDDFSNEAKLREYELQIYFGFELNFNDEKGNDSEHLRIVSILRTMSFMHDPSFLHDYLNSSLLENYLITCPNLMHSIYEDLLLPMPSQLHHLCSPSSIFSFDDSDPKDDAILSPESVSSIMTAPWSDFDLLIDKPDRPSQLLRNVSFSQAPRRQIELSMPNHNINQHRRSERIASVKKKKVPTATLR